MNSLSEFIGFKNTILDLFPFLRLQAGLGLVVFSFIGSGEPGGVVSAQAVPLLFRDPSW